MTVDYGLIYFWSTKLLRNIFNINLKMFMKSFCIYNFTVLFTHTMFKLRSRMKTVSEIVLLKNTKNSVKVDKDNNFFDKDNNLFGTLEKNYMIASKRIYMEN